MNVNTSHLRSIDEGGLPEYPISVHDRLDSHYFIQWNLKRWRKSVFRQLAEPDVGWFGFLLFCESHDETPVGTLPTDERLLAKAVEVPIERWRQLCSRDITPLHNWARVQCDNGEVRLAHPVMTEVTLEALKSKRANSQRTAERKQAKQRKDLSEMLERIGAAHMLKNPAFLDRFLSFVDENYPGKQRREGLVREALDAFSLQVTG